MITSRGPVRLLSCESGRAFMRRALGSLQERFTREANPEPPAEAGSHTVVFDNTEIKTVIDDVIRGTDLYVFQLFDDPLSPRSVNDNIIELLTVLDAAFYSDPEYVTVIVPQFPYSRQERRHGREPVTAKLVAQMFEMVRAHRVVTIDIHAEAIGGFFRQTKFENIHIHTEIVNFIREFVKDLSDFKIVAPDVGSAKRGRTFARMVGLDMAIIDKQRDPLQPHLINELKLVGDVDGKHIILPDDIIGTGGTILGACRLLKEKGARDIYITCTFPFFNGKAVERLQQGYAEGLFKAVIGTDCVWWGDDFSQANPWYVEVSMGRLVADIVYNINHRLGISALIDARRSSTSQ